MDNQGRMVATGVGAMVGAPFAYFTTKVFEAWGVLDDLALQLGTFLKKTVTPAQAGWTFGLLLYLAFMALFLWLVWHKRRTPEKLDTVPVDHVPPSPPVPSNNTYLNAGDGVLPSGHGNTVVRTTDDNGNTILNRGGLAIGAGAQADATSIAIGAGAGGSMNQNADLARKRKADAVAAAEKEFNLLRERGKTLDEHWERFSADPHRAGYGGFLSAISQWRNDCFFIKAGLNTGGKRIEVDQTVRVDILPICNRMDEMTPGQAETFKQAYIDYCQLKNAIKSEEATQEQIMQDNR